MRWNIYFKSIFLFFTLLFVGPVMAQTTATGDATITQSVKSKMSADKSLDGTTISVSTKNGVVNLSGTVDSDTQASSATELAQATPGVTDVDTANLKVAGSDQPITDTFITAKVKGSFIQQKLFGEKDVASMTISVETNNGVVSLSGTADNQAQITNAVKIAKSVSGVKEVKSTVTVDTATTKG